MLASCRSSAKPISISHHPPSPVIPPRSSMMRAAIVGLGRWGRSLVTSVQGKSSDIRFVLAHTRTRAAAGAFCREHELPLADSYEQVLADPKVDAVVLATPHSLHAQQIAAAATAGKHIHVEKPITLTRASADAAVAAARKAAVGSPAGSCRAFLPTGAGLARALKTGRPGTGTSLWGHHTPAPGQFIPPA